VIGLTEHWSNAPHLPHDPFDCFIPLSSTDRCEKFSSTIGKIDKNSTTLEDTHWLIVTFRWLTIDKRWNF
jgi:hypothetical protein